MLLVDMPILGGVIGAFIVILTAMIVLPLY